MSAAVEGTFVGRGGVPIRWQRAGPAAPRGVVLVAHGYAEHLGRYAELVAHFTARGLATAALDHRGHGRSGGPRGHCRDFEELVADLRTLADLSATWWPQAPRLLFGHSMGGLVAFLYLLRHPTTVRAGVLSAPAFRIPAHAPRPLTALALLLGRVLPRVRFRTALDPGALARDPAVGRAYVADPLVHRTATAGFFRALSRAQARALREAPQLAVPVLVLQGDADRIVDPGGAAAVAARLAVAHELVWLPGFYHELLNEPPAERARVLALLDAWCDRWLGGP